MELEKRRLDFFLKKKKGNKMHNLKLRQSDAAMLRG